MRIISGMETPNPTMIRFRLSLRSFSRASRSRSPVSSPSMPRYLVARLLDGPPHLRDTDEDGL